MTLKTTVKEKARPKTLDFNQLEVGHIYEAVPKTNEDASKGAAHR